MDKLTPILLPYLVILPLAVTAAASDFNYTAPSYCTGSRRPEEDNAVVLLCEIPSMNYTFAVEAIPAWKTTYLTIFGHTHSNFRSDIFPGTFKHLNELKLLELLNCQLDVIRMKAFEGLTSLQHLTIAQASMRVLPTTPFFHPRFEHVFIDTPNLLSLDLESNALSSSSIPNDLFCPLKKLQTLNLRLNMLTGSSNFGIFCPEKGGVYPLANLNTLKLSQNLVEKLNSTTFTYTPNLEHLDISGMAISELPEDIFQTLSSLSHLNLSSNLLQNVPTFKYHRALVNLTIANNNISSLASDTFSRLYRLKFLSVSKNKLSLLPEQIFQDLLTLRHLDISHNQIRHIPQDTFKYLRSLKHLYLHGNQIQDIGPGAFLSLNSLIYLDLHLNRITTINNNTFTGLNNILLLDLSKNTLNETKDAFAPVSKLLWLNLQQNELQSVPKSLQNRRNLQYLYLDHNKISGISASDFKGMNLKHLFISHNNLSHLPFNVFQHVQGLTAITLNHNMITRVASNSFYPLSRLETLMLSYNDIKDISYIFRSLPTLRTLDLSHNNITKLHRYSLPSSLVTLKLGENPISAIEPLTFISLTYLKFVNLTYNNLSVIDISSFRTPYKTLLSNRAIFYLKGRIINCNCRSQWLLQSPLHQRTLPVVADINSLYCWTIHDGRRLKHIASAKEDDFQCPDTENCPTNCSCFHTFSKNQRSVRCESKALTRIPKINKPTTHLYLQQNSLDTIGPHDVSNLPALKVLHLEYSSIKLIEEGAFTNLSKLESLFLQGNLLESISSNQFEDLINLQILRLDNNHIIEISSSSFHPLDSLQTLNLKNNQLTHLHKELLGNQTNLSQLKNTTLAHNPWACNCSATADFQKWLTRMSGKISDVMEIKCNPPFSSKIPGGFLNISAETPIIEMNLSDCKRIPLPQGLHSQKSYINLFISLACIFLLLCIVTLVLYNCKELLKVWLFARYGVRFRPPKEDADKRYDAFISYSSKDEDFLAEELLPQLEAGPKKYRLCVHYRDWPVGASIAESIVSSVESSKRTIILLSKNFLDSEWCFCEFKTAHHKLLQDRTNRVIIILLEDIPKKSMDDDMKLYMKTKTFIKYDDAWFWDKLRYVMPDTANAENPESPEIALNEVKNDDQNMI